MSTKSTKFRHATNWLLSPITLKIRSPLREWNYDMEDINQESGTKEMIVTPLS